MDALTDDDDLLQTETLTEKAYRALEEEIVTLRIPPGTMVSEAIPQPPPARRPHPGPRGAAAPRSGMAGGHHASARHRGVRH